MSDRFNYYERGASNFFSSDVQKYNIEEVRNLSDVFSEKMFVEEKMVGSSKTFREVVFVEENRTRNMKLFPVSESVFSQLELGKPYVIEIKKVSR